MQDMLQSSCRNLKVSMDWKQHLEADVTERLKAHPASDFVLVTQLS